VTRADLASSEVSWDWLRGRLATREWSRVQRGVYRLGCNQSTLDEREMAALLAAGEGAVLSHVSAARRIGLSVPPRDESVHVSIPASRKAKVRAAKIWRSRTLTAGEVTMHRRFRLTSLARTLVDLASVFDDGWLRAAFDSAVRQDKKNVGRIWRALARCGRGCRGVSRLRRLLEEYRRGEEVPDSAMESLGVELAQATGRKPKLHYNVCDGERHVAEVDLAWPELWLCVQFDGWKYHCTRQAFVKDRAQDRALFHLGWTVLRYPWDDVVHEPDSVIEGLVRSFELLSRSRHGVHRRREPLGATR